MPYKDISINGKTIFETFKLPNDLIERLKKMIKN